MRARFKNRKIASLTPRRLLPTWTKMPSMIRREQIEGGRNLTPVLDPRRIANSRPDPKLQNCAASLFVFCGSGVNIRAMHYERPKNLSWTKWILIGRDY